MSYDNYPQAGALGTDGLFPQHPREGDWETLEGDMLAPHIMMPLESVAMNRAGVQSGTRQPDWNSQITVQTGLTPGGGTMAR